MLYDKRWDAKVKRPKDSPVVARLQRARSLVERGWCQYQGDDGLGNVCASTALNRATNRNQSFSTDHARFALVSAIEWENIPAWNDHPGRTKAEVLEAFDRAIEITRRDQ